MASGLKWQLFSNSVIIMRVACRVSWAMEDKLVPYKHYVPVDSSMSNLETVLDWCGENDDVCCEIARNGKKYIEQFLDLDREDRLEKEIIERYAQNVTFV